jgi:dienelactone hydrolase/lysophospholipase L1-like esterase
MKFKLLTVLATLLPTIAIGQTPSKPDAPLPKVVLVGDSIRLSYAPFVAKTLSGRAVVVSPKGNGGDSSNVLKQLEAWVIRERPAVVHFNSGIHDTKKFRKSGKFQVSPEQYESNLRAIVTRIRKETDAVVLFGTTTPTLDDRAAKTRSERDYELLGASVEQYNGIAAKVMRELDVPVNDLHLVLSKPEAPLTTGELIGTDGVHLTEVAREMLGRQVALFVGKQLPGPSGRKAESGPWSIEKLQEAPAVTWLDEKSPIRSLTYRNENFQNHETDVFAFYATPGSISGDATKDRNLPAVVLIHGGGGTAFAEWALLWARRGYAAIAMDLSGRRPKAPKFDEKTGELIPNLRATRTRLERGGPEADHIAKFTNVGGDISDDWQFHAVAAVVRAHSLIRSFPEVDADRTAVTGISWGGYMTCLVASIDDRFKAAVPVYGCGFLYEGESVQKRMIDELTPEKRDEWIRVYEPSAWLPKCRVPILFVNGTNDKHYPLTSYARSYELVKGPRQVRIEVNMRHGHVAGWAPKEIGLFVDQHVKNGAALPKLGSPEMAGDKVSATVVSSVPLKLGELHFTADSGPLVNRRWQSTKATIEGESISALVPETATIWMLSTTDSRDAMVSSEVVFRKTP